MEYVNIATLTLPLFTATGAFGGMPPAPKIFQELSKQLWFQWLMVWVLVMQGGAGMNVTLATVTVIVAFVLVRVLDMVYKGNTKETYIQYSH